MCINNVNYFSSGAMILIIQYFPRRLKVLLPLVSSYYSILPVLLCPVLNDSYQNSHHSLHCEK